MTAPAPFISTEAPAPTASESIFGHEMDFLALVELSDWQNVISTRIWPEVYLHERDAGDYVALRDGKPVYLVSVLNAPEDGDLREIARETLRRLAYGCKVWEAFEIVERAQRDAERAGSIAPRPSGDDGLEKGFTNPVPADVQAARKAMMKAKAVKDRAAWDDMIASQNGKPKP